jgi:hypothetical protein
MCSAGRPGPAIPPVPASWSDRGVASTNAEVWKADFGAPATLLHDKTVECQSCKCLYTNNLWTQKHPS